MAPQSGLAEAVRVAIVAAAHAEAYERVAAAGQACRRLGGLSSGRWRSAARDLERLEEDLERSFDQATRDLVRRAADLEIDAQMLWSAGEAAGTLDLLRETAREALGDNPAAQLLDGDVLFGAAFEEDDETPNRGTTLLFAWSDPLAPASWPWEANWIAGEGDEDEDEDEEELDLSAAGSLDASSALVADVCQRLGLSSGAAETALLDVAAALTQESLLAVMGEDDDEDGSRNGHV